MFAYRQGLEGRVPFLEAKLAELKAENKPLALTLKQVIQALSAEEVHCFRVLFCFVF